MRKEKPYILIIEDDPNAYEILLYEFSKSQFSEKYNIERLDRPKEGLIFIENHKVALIITEIVFGASKNVEAGEIDIDIIVSAPRTIPIIVYTEFYRQTINIIQQYSNILAGYIDKSSSSIMAIQLYVSQTLNNFYKKPSNLIRIQFKRSIWGQLFPIEQALSLKLGDEYIVKKSSDFLEVNLESPEQLQSAIDCIVTVLAGFESVSTGEIKNVSVLDESGLDESLNSKEILSILRYIKNRFDAEFPVEKDGHLSWTEETLIEAVKSVPGGGILEPTLKRWFSGKTFFDKINLKIYKTYKNFFCGAKGITGLKDSQYLLSSRRNDLKDNNGH